MTLETLRVLLGHVCLWSVLAGVYALLAPKQRLELLSMLIRGIIFGLLAGTAQLLLFK